MYDLDKLQQLKQQLAEFDEAYGDNNHLKIDALNELAWMLFFSDNQQASERQAYDLSETALALAESSKDGNPPYKAGMAYSLCIQEYLNKRLENYAFCLTQIIQAQEISVSLECIVWFDCLYRKPRTPVYT